MKFEITKQSIEVFENTVEFIERGNELLKEGWMINEIIDKQNGYIVLMDFKTMILDYKDGHVSHKDIQV